MKLVTIIPLFMTLVAGNLFEESDLQPFETAKHSETDTLFDSDNDESQKELDDLNKVDFPRF